MFAAQRIIHRAELAAQPDAEIVLEGTEPVPFGPDFLAIPTPGHTRGHCVLLYKQQFLFTGDHRRFPQPKIDQHFGSSREAHGYWKTTGRFHNQGMTWLGWSRAASRRIGLWQRLSKCTTIRSGWMSTTPAVSTNLRYSCLGAAGPKPRRCLASHREQPL